MKWYDVIPPFDIATFTFGDELRWLLLAIDSGLGDPTPPSLGECEMQQAGASKVALSFVGGGSACGAARLRAAHHRVARCGARMWR